jgi:ectoine hydroxylase-related dioxygenase (phytanoyl-CoA dioxygenase family)
MPAVAGAPQDVGPCTQVNCKPAVPFQSFAVSGSTGDDETDRVLREIHIKGWAIIEGVIPRDEVGAVREDMERVHHVHGKTDIPYILNYTQRFAPYLASEKLLRPMRAIFEGQHIRMRSNKGFVHPPRDTPSTNIAAHGTETDHLSTVGEILESGGLHADGPFIQSNAVRVAAPYPDCTMQMQTVWMLSDFTKENGGTKVATGTHLFQTNPTSRRTFDGVSIDYVERDVHKDLESLHGAGSVSQPHHIDSAEGKAGSVLLFDVCHPPTRTHAHTHASRCWWMRVLSFFR